MTAGSSSTTASPRRASISTSWCGPRAEPGPAFDLPVADIIDFLVAVGERLDLDTNQHLQHALEFSLSFSSLGERILAQAYRGLPGVFERSSLWFQVEQEVGRAALDGWTPSDGSERTGAAHPRLPASPDPRARRQHAGRHRDLDRPRCVHEGRPPPQAAVERPAHRHRDPPHDGRRRSRPPGHAVVLVRVLARR